MPKLIELWNAAKAADAQVQSVLAEMQAAFDDGTEEGKQKALDLRPALDEAKAAAEAANLLYIEARDAEPEGPNAAARLFVPADGSVTGGAKEITRSQYEAMSPADRNAHFKSGGSIVEDPA